MEVGGHALLDVDVGVEVQTQSVGKRISLLVGFVQWCCVWWRLYILDSYRGVGK
jgi:hypothetical protein